MSLRRSLVLSAPLALCAFAAAQGCGSEPLPEDLCSFLLDDNSCYARFADDILDVDASGLDWCSAREFDADSDPVASATGFFQARDDLSICIRSAGGQVIFDPPLDATMFPVTSLAVNMLDSKANACGMLAIMGTQSFSVSINPVDADDDSPTAPLEAASLEDDITGGTFASAASLEAANTFDVTCPGGVETHHFNSLITTKCGELDPFVPRAFIDSNPGIPETTASSAVPGFVRARIVYPPADPSDPAAEPRIIEYFNCLIPAPPPPCENGVRDGDETDMDCGGSCPGKCADGLGCLKDADCQSGDCSAPQGLLMCQPPPR